MVFCIAGRDGRDGYTRVSLRFSNQVIANPDDMSEVAKECIMTVVPLQSQEVVLDSKSLTQWQWGIAYCIYEFGM